MQHYNNASHLGSAWDATIQQYNNATIQQCKPSEKSVGYNTTLKQYNNTTLQQYNSATLQPLIITFSHMFLSLSGLV
jgi:hypothetical protein